MQLGKHSQLVTLLPLFKMRHCRVQREHDPKQETRKGEREWNHEQQQYQGGRRLEFEFDDPDGIQHWFFTVKAVVRQKREGSYLQRRSELLSKPDT